MRFAALVGGSMTLVAGLLVAVFIGVQLLGSSSQAVGPASGPDDGDSEAIRVMEIAVERVKEDGSGPVSSSVAIKIKTLAAPELPDSKPTTVGVLVDSNADGITVGTGSIEADLRVEMKHGEDPVRDVTLSHSGPEVNVVVDSGTTFYQEVTDIPSFHDFQGDIPDGDITIQQEVLLVGSLDGIGDGDAVEVQVWGEPQGDDLVADVVVYRIVDEL